MARGLIEELKHAKGAVVNVTRWLGIFGNRSTTFNFSSPQQDIYNVLVPQPLSQSKDVGIRFTLPNNRLSASAAWFNAYQKGSPTGTPSGFIGNYNAIGDLGPVGADNTDAGREVYRPGDRHAVITGNSDGVIYTVCATTKLAGPFACKTVPVANTVAIDYRDGRFGAGVTPILFEL